MSEANPKPTSVNYHVEESSKGDDKSVMKSLDCEDLQSSDILDIDFATRERDKSKCQIRIARGKDGTIGGYMVWKWLPKDDKEFPKLNVGSGTGCWGLMTARVVKGLQGQGLGSMLMEDGFFELEYTSKHIYVKSATALGRELYKKFGFEGVGKVDDYALQDMVRYPDGRRPSDDSIPEATSKEDEPEEVFEMET